MTATYDWGKQGPDFLAHRTAQYATDIRLILGANTFRMFRRYLGDLTRGAGAEFVARPAALARQPDRTGRFWPPGSGTLTWN